MTVLLQLNPSIPLTTPKGKGLAVLVMDLSEEHHLQWVVIDDVTGEVWCWPNTHVRGQSNVTMGRNRPNLPPSDGFDAGPATPPPPNALAASTGGLYSTPEPDDEPVATIHPTRIAYSNEIGGRIGAFLTDTVSGRDWAIDPNALSSPQFRFHPSAVLGMTEWNAQHAAEDAAAKYAELETRHSVLADLVRHLKELALSQSLKIKALQAGSTVEEVPAPQESRCVIPGVKITATMTEPKVDERVASMRSRIQFYEREVEDYTAEISALRAQDRANQTELRHLRRLLVQMESPTTETVAEVALGVQVITEDDGDERP